MELWEKVGIAVILIFIGLFILAWINSSHCDSHFFWNETLKQCVWTGRG